MTVLLTDIYIARDIKRQSLGSVIQRQTFRIPNNLPRYKYPSYHLKPKSNKNLNSISRKPSMQNISWSSFICVGHSVIIFSNDSMDRRKVSCLHVSVIF